MAKFQPPPIQGQTFLDGDTPSWTWQKWFELLSAAMSSPAVPVSSSATGTPMQIPGIASDGNYLYICTAANTWKRVALSAF
ncbi:MAG: hypothetical protein JWQ87_2251 [Candidatus Sulfotelmatobacter sp.]|nr:hypothetical protein [Candidatus Sulfotelmatobacter sp.]